GGAREEGGRPSGNVAGAGGMHFRGFPPGASPLLLGGDVRGIGPDPLAIDPGVDRRYLGHHLLFRAGRWAAECVANLDQIPARGATVLLATTKVEGATGGPARILAFW